MSMSLKSRESRQVSSIQPNSTIGLIDASLMPTWIYSVGLLWFFLCAVRKFRMITGTSASEKVAIREIYKGAGCPVQ